MTDPSTISDIRLRLEQAEALFVAGAEESEVASALDRLLAHIHASQVLDSGVRADLHARALLLRGRSLCRQDRYVDALDLYAEALKVLECDPSPTQSTRVAVLTQMGFSCMQLAMAEPALRCATAALKLALGSGQTLQAAIALERVGMCYELLGAPVESERFMLEALGMALQAGTEASVIGRLSNLVALACRLADLHRAQGDEEAAAQALRRCIRHFARGDALLASAAGYDRCHWRLNRAIWLARRDEAALAEEGLDACRREAMDRGWHAISLHSGLELARLMAKAARHPEAIALLRTTVAERGGSDTYEVRMQAHRLLAALLAAEGQPEGAAEHREIHRRLQVARQQQYEGAQHQLARWERGVVQALAEADRIRLDAELQRLQSLQLQSPHFVDPGAPPPAFAATER